MQMLLLYVLACTASTVLGASRDENATVDEIQLDEEMAIESMERREEEDVNRRYKPDWADLDTRPLPEWYDRAKIGIMLHWGVFSVPAFENEWFWHNWVTRRNKNIVRFMAKNYPPGFSYQDFAPMFTAELFDPNQWATLFAKSGARYVILTSKHHEGYTLFPSKQSFSWNSVDVGPNRDLVGDLARAVRNKRLQFGLYHSLYEWYNPMYTSDQANNYTTTVFRDHKVWPDLKQLVNNYKPCLIWSDGEWEAADDYWNSTGLLAWLYNESPVKDHVVVNDRWGKGTRGKHGDYYNWDDAYDPGHLMNHKWENAFPLDTYSYGYRRGMNIWEVVDVHQLLTLIIRTVSCGGNALINVGPTKEGTIVPIFQERLLALGKWLDINGESIYNTSPWFHQNDTSNGNVWYTCTKAKYNGHRAFAKPEPTDAITAIYAIVVKWPENNVLIVKDLKEVLESNKYHVIMLDQRKFLEWKIDRNGVSIQLPDMNIVKSEYAWALKISQK